VRCARHPAVGMAPELSGTGLRAVRAGRPHAGPRRRAAIGVGLTLVRAPGRAARRAASPPPATASARGASSSSAPARSRSTSLPPRPRPPTRNGHDPARPRAAGGGRPGHPPSRWPSCWSWTGTTWRVADGGPFGPRGPGGRPWPEVALFRHWPARPGRLPVGAAQSRERWPTAPFAGWSRAHRLRSARPTGTPRWPPASTTI